MGGTSRPRSRSGKPSECRTFTIRPRYLRPRWCGTPKGDEVRAFEGRLSSHPLILLQQSFRERRTLLTTVPRVE
jgi:hypothetical protein